jgi:catechol 2,3-dioxygenase-like lactoylglutathione lyase family enzyme
VEALDPIPPVVSRIARWALNVRDLDRAVGFYVDALGFAVASLAEDRARLTLGEQALDLVRQPQGAGYPEPRAANDPWFQHLAIAVADMDAAFTRLSRHAPTPITHGGPQLLPPSTGSVTAYKFRDPDGHPLELSFVPGSEWLRTGAPGAGATRGIDHTALEVGDLEASIAFYTGLGFRLDARLRNRGPEQARLDGLDDPVVDIAVLRTPGAGPHVELLHYRSPAPPRPVAIGPHDIAATVTVLAGPAGSPVASAERVDPDGHRLRIVSA